MIPVIALVGRPNVGKSTLFNRLTRTQAALVADFPGLTRDRQYGEANIDGHAVIVVDTGGIGVDDSTIDALMSLQSRVAIQEADVIFFLVDARTGLTPVDIEIANNLRKQGKVVQLVANKIDGISVDIACGEFEQLGFPVYGIAAAHGRGVKPLLQATLANLPKSNIDESPLELKPGGIHIAMVGRPNVGKSTLINRMLGEERVVVCDHPGTTRDSISIPFERDDEQYTLIDTAGVRRRSRVDEKVETFSIIKTLQSIKAAHVCLLLLDAQEGLTTQDLHLLGFVLEAGKALVLLVNKWDNLDDERKHAMRDALDRRASFISFVKIRYISALHGTGVGTLFKDIHQAYAAAMKTFSTPYLTRLTHAIIEKNPPPMASGRTVKIRYAHMGGHNPPIIVLHGNRLTSLPDSYKRYLRNAYGDALNMVGTPIKLEFKTGENPYQNKKNVPTDRQRRSKKRLMKHVKKK